MCVFSLCVCACVCVCVYSTLEYLIGKPGSCSDTVEAAPPARGARPLPLGGRLRELSLTERRRLHTWSGSVSHTVCVVRYDDVLHTVCVACDLPHAGPGSCCWGAADQCCSAAAPPPQGLGCRDSVLAWSLCLGTLTVGTVLWHPCHTVYLQPEVTYCRI